MYNGYYFGVSMLAVEGRFDCTYLYAFEKDQPHKVFPRKRLEENNVYQMKGLHRLISLTMEYITVVLNLLILAYPQIKIVPLSVPMCSPK